MSRGEFSPICPKCNKATPPDSMVSMSDDGKGLRTCIRCKRAIKRGLPITWRYKESRSVEL
jgi:hypothetical protein